MTNRRVTFSPILQPIYERKEIPLRPYRKRIPAMSRKSKPTYTLTLDSASDRFTFDYASNGIQVHAEGPFAKLMPQLRSLAAPVTAMLVQGQCGLGEAHSPLEISVPAAAPKKPAKKKTRRTVKTKKA